MDITNENLVSTFRASGQTQETFCKNNGISLERLRYYLYKKDHTQSKPRKYNRKKSKTPAFISFNRPDCSPSKIVQDTKNIYTVIHGKFTHSQLVTLIRELER
jgi:hypothetical protein